jgi:exodeoxyribonuclease VII large subunit
MQQRLHALDPRQVLARGYTWLQDAAGQPVMSAQAVAPGQVLQAVWVDGAAQVLVQTVKPTAAQAVAQPVAKDARA